MRLTRIIFGLLCMATLMAHAGENAESRMQQAARQALGTRQPLQCVMNDNQMAVYRQPSGGFAIIADAGQSARLLAYSRTAPLDLNSDNPGFQWWWRAAQGVAKQHKSNHAKITKPDPERFAPSIDSLMTTIWGQTAPYNAWCPTANGNVCEDYAPNVEHCLVGCVATALAQVVHYHGKPHHAEGESDFFIGDQPRHTSFAGTYDWANMLDTYADDFTEAQGRAVAQLSYHCGLISQMNYGTNASGTANQAAINGLVQFFGYSDAMHTVVRSEYDEPAWMEMIYNELNNSRPILYQGVEVNFVQGIIGGHSFVIDGYDENGLVHVNWGWLGDANGYFDVAMLNPRIYELNDYQDMVVGLAPAWQSLPGDVNGDGTIDISDVNATINIMMGTAQTSDFSGAPDIDGDGEVNISDVNAVINLMLGK